MCTAMTISHIRHLSKTFLIILVVEVQFGEHLFMHFLFFLLIMFLLILLALLNCVIIHLTKLIIIHYIVRLLHKIDQLYAL